jgi:hypothetical protein
MNERPAERVTLAGRDSTAFRKVLPSGAQAAALDELRAAAATFDYLRSKEDPVEFWEALRLARSRRALAPTADGALPAPSEEEDRILRQELDIVRSRFAELVAAVKDFLEGAPDLPQPAERFELALAFLMASSREHEAVAQWLKDPEGSRARAVSKLRSLAAITDPYREALLPWSLGAAL